MQLVLATKNGVAIWKFIEEKWRLVRRGVEKQEITCVSASQNRILAGTVDGVLRSEDSGESWQQGNSGLKVTHTRWIAHDPSNPDHVLLGTEPAEIHLSHDSGESWERRPEIRQYRAEGRWSLPYSENAGCVRDFAFHGSNVYAAVEQGGLLVSRDSGRSWELTPGSTGTTEKPPEGSLHPDVHSVEVHPSSPDLLLAATGGGLFRSFDGAKSWTNLYECYCRAVWLDPQDPNFILLSPAEGVSRKGRIELSRDAGESWNTASRGLDTPWADDLVERFVSTSEQLLAVRAKGEVMSAEIKNLHWRSPFDESSEVRAAAWLTTHD